MKSDSRERIDHWDGCFLQPGASRREFLLRSGLGLCALPLLGSAAKLIPASAASEQFVREARYVKRLDELRVESQLCPRKC